MDSHVNDLQPPVNWGVVARSRNIKDFKRTILPTVAATVPVLVSIVFLTTGLLSPLGQQNADGLKAFAVVLGIPTVIWAMYSWSVAWNAAGDEAVGRAAKALSDWQNTVLKPFLETKHGVKIVRTDESSWWFMDYLEASHPKQGVIRVKISGLEVRDYYYPEVAFSDECATPPLLSVVEEPSLVEIIPATKASSRPLAVVAA